MAEKRITRQLLKHHFSYSWWKYLIVIVVSILGVNVLFTTTAYRSPENKKIEVYVLNDFVTAHTMQEELWPLFHEQYPEQEELTVTNINLNGSDAYAYMQFSTYVAAQQGDVCIMPASEVHKLAASGADAAFLELSAYVESGAIDVKDIDLTRGRFRAENGKEGLYAIPADTLYGMLDHGNDPADSFLVIFGYGGNDEHAAAVANLMIDLYHREKPDGYDELHQKRTNSATIF